MDTRGGSNTVGARNTPIAAGESYVATVHGSNGNCTVPANATGIATNTTVVNGTAASFLTLYPSNSSRPLASNLNWTAGQAPTPNQVTVGLSPDGGIRIYNDKGTVNVIIDIVGVYTDLGTRRASISFPAQGLNIQNPGGSAITRDDSGSLRWLQGSDGSATASLLRPADFSGTGTVTVSITYRPVFEDSEGGIRFTLYPFSFDRDAGWQGEGPILTETTCLNLAGPDDYRVATGTFPASRLERDVWSVGLARDMSVALAHAGTLWVDALTIEYDAYR